MVPIAPSQTMTWSGSSSRAMSGLSGNGSLRLGARARIRTAYGVVLGFGVVNDNRGGGLLGHQLECFGQLHAECFGRREQLEHRGVIVEIRTRTIPPRIPLALRHPELALDPAVRPLSDCFGRLDPEAVRVERLGILVLR